VACSRAPWPEFKSYAGHFIAADGRVVDHTDHARSTSEGQAYGLFLALVANDRKRFKRILRWTANNLARGRLDKNLPAWLWGRSKKGKWGVLDRNAASDADLWMAYALLEARRLWRVRRYGRLGRALLAQVAAKEVVTMPGLGRVLMPAPVGFVVDKDKRWRLNPSYVPLQLLRRFEAVDAKGPWADIAASSARLLTETAPSGLAPDWVDWQAKKGWVSAGKKRNVAGYDAIRTYLWAGMLHAEEPMRSTLDDALGGMLEFYNKYGWLPERSPVGRALPIGSRAPVGYYACVLPMAMARGDAKAARSLQARIVASVRDGHFGEPATYYDQNLVLFGLGWARGRYAFGADGRLLTAWRKGCSAR